MPMLPEGWTPTRSRAIEAYRYLPDQGVLQILYRTGRKVYDFPCDAAIYQAFVATSSKGRFVERVLKRHAQALGWSRKPYKLR